MDQAKRTFRSKDRLPLLLSGLIALCILVSSLGLAHSGVRAAKFQTRSEKGAVSISIAFDSRTDASWFTLEAPYRLVVDLPQTSFAFERSDLESTGMLTNVRYGNAGLDRSRLIFTLAQPFEVENFEMVGSSESFTLNVRLNQVSKAAFSVTRHDSVDTTASIAVPGSSGEPQPRFKVVIDPGHGGVDGGAKGRNGAIEKDVTLAFATQLKFQMETQGNFDVVMTRTDDRFLRLEERVEFARAHSADLLISIHADTIRFSGLRGATVYTVSDKASDAESEALAERENLADSLPGLHSSQENPDVSDILYDFVRRETQGFSNHAAGVLVDHLSKSVGVINNPHRHARFRVLRAPDVPSILLELGYLSNTQDERSLTDPEWRKMAASSIVTAVGEFAAARNGKTGVAGN